MLRLSVVVLYIFFIVMWFLGFCVRLGIICGVKNNMIFVNNLIVVEMRMNFFMVVYFILYSNWYSGLFI